MDLDKTSKEILNILLDNSRLSYRQIAKKIKVSVATVMNRIKNMESNGVIEKYSAQLNYEKLGYDVQVIIEIRVSKGKLFQVEKKLANNPNVFAVYDVTGDFDGVIIAKFRNRRKMDNFLKLIQTYEFIERTKTKLILNNMKETPTKIS